MWAWKNEQNDQKRFEKYIDSWKQLKEKSWVKCELEQKKRKYNNKLNNKYYQEN